MKRTVLPHRDEVASRNQQAASRPVQRYVPCENGRDQLPLTSTHQAPPSYQDMADASTVVQAAETMQMAADVLAPPAMDEPPVQGWFYYTSTRIDAKYLENSEKVKWLEGVMREGKKARELLRGSTKHQGEKLVSDRLAAIIALARQPDQFKPKKEVMDKDGLRALADDEIRQSASLMVEQAQIRAYHEQLKNAQPDAEVEYLSPELDLNQRVNAMADTLKKMGAFPDANIDYLHEQGLDGQKGFITELEIAYHAAISHPEDRVQVGALDGSDPSGYLGFQTSKHQPLKPNLHIGADIVIWSQTEKSGRKTQFIQSKDVQDESNLVSNAEAAANQLTGKGANGEGLGAGEYTYTGQNYEGIVFLRLIQNKDFENIKKAASKAFSSGKQFVSKVIVQVDLDQFDSENKTWLPGFYTFSTPPELAYLKTSHNPIFGTGDKPVVPKHQDDAEEHPRGQEVKQKDGVVVLPGEHLQEADVEDDAELITAQEAEESIAVEQSMAQSEPLASIDARAIQDEPESQPIPKAKANPKPQKGGTNGKPAKKLTKQQKKSIKHPVKIIRKSNQGGDNG